MEQTLKTNESRFINLSMVTQVEFVLSQIAAYSEVF